MEHEVWLNKAAENLAAAQLCFEHGQYNACANRLYYARFHAALAALAQGNFDPARGKVSHEWLQANFTSRFIHRRKIFHAKFRSYLSDAQALRDIADYKLFAVSKDAVSRELKKAVEFVNMIKQEVAHEAQS